MKRKFTDDIVIVLAGEAGQGIQSIESLLSTLIKRSGYNFFSASEFMSRVRGGSNSTEMRISSKPVAGYVDRIDILLPLHAEAMQRLKKRISGDTIILADKSTVGAGNLTDIGFARIAAEIGGPIYTNTVASGVICGLLKIAESGCEAHILEYFASKADDVRNRNLLAFQRGYAEGKALEGIEISIAPNDSVTGELLLSGADAVALGALAGGCDYVCGYPMSPATSVLEKMAALSLGHSIIVEQVEDEVGVVNMAIGAWYAGARALVSTSGGGFALMTEGISLAGMIESPLVVHLAQRPGPATGLPTRTEQGDLNLVLYAGHGDFPRIILAPGTLEEGFNLSRQAFSLADKYQVPVFVLTDQFFVDSKYNTPSFDTCRALPQKYISKTDPDYKRFLITDSGISPRGVPGFGKGCVCADSDEHDESGHITEDLDLRARMVDKRKRKAEAILADAIEPTLVGPADYATLVVCWGSTFNIVSEAVVCLGEKDVAVLHFSWIFPLSGLAGGYLKKAARLILVENNSSAQFADLLLLSTGVRITERILKYNGLPFSVEEVKKELETRLRDGGQNGK